MKILIAADMEGISGVVHWDQVNTTHPEYARFRKIMTGDVNAAIQGATEGGADEILVTDGHASGRNILVEELLPQARLNSGTPSPLSMVEGVDTGVVGVIYVGYHARIGTQNAILEHTWSDERVSNVLVNGQPFGEIGLNAAVCGHFGVPVIMISGDQSACAEAQALLGNLETAVVKMGHSRFAAECLPPLAAQERIREAARRAVASLKEGIAPKSLQVKTPITLAVDFMHSEMADKAALMPGASRSSRRVEYTAADMPTIYRAFRTLLALARA